MSQPPKPSRASNDNDDTVRIEAVPRRAAAAPVHGKPPLWRRRWAWIALLGLAFAIVIVLIVASTQSAAHPATPQVTRIVPAENTVALGSPLVVDGLVMVVTKVDIKDGVVAVEMLVKNTGTKKLNISKTAVILFTPDEKVQELDANATAKLGTDGLSFGKLAPGQNVSGTLLFSSSVYKLPQGMMLRLSNSDLFKGSAFLALWK